MIPVSKYARSPGRNLVLGLATVYPATVGLCFAAIGDLGQSPAIATVPAIFAGPCMGLLITLISAVAPGRSTQAATADASRPPVVAPSVPMLADAAA